MHAAQIRSKNDTCMNAGLDVSKCSGEFGQDFHVASSFLRAQGRFMCTVKMRQSGAAGSWPHAAPSASDYARLAGIFMSRHIFCRARPLSSIQ